LARIQAADSTRVADENFRGFALGEKLKREVRSHRTPQKNSKKRSLVRASQPGLGSKEQQQQLSRARLNRAAA
jgi:hypothetical protein